MGEIILSRSTFSDGDNKLPSRWLLRLKKILSGSVGIEISKDLFRHLCAKELLHIRC